MNIIKNSEILRREINSMVDEQLPTATMKEKIQGLSCSQGDDREVIQQLVHYINQIMAWSMTRTNNLDGNKKSDQRWERWGTGTTCNPLSCICPILSSENFRLLDDDWKNDWSTKFYKSDCLLLHVRDYFHYYVWDWIFFQIILYGMTSCA